MQVSPCEMGATCTASGHLLNLVDEDYQSAGMGFSYPTEAYSVVLDTHLASTYSTKWVDKYLVSCIISVGPMQMC